MASFPIEALYAATPKADAELQADIDAPADKAGTSKGDALLKAAVAFLQREELEQALKSVKEALTIFREHGAEGQEAVAECLLAKVRTGGVLNLEAFRKRGLLFLGTASLLQLKALRAAKRSLKIFKELGERKGQAAAFFVSAQVHAATPSPEDAAWNAREACKIFSHEGDKAGEAAALGILARCYALQQDYKRGLQTAQDAVAVMRELGDGPREAAALCVLAQMHLGLGEHELGMLTARDALSKCQALGQSTDEALDLIMSACKTTGARDDAVLAAQQECERLRQAGESRAEALCLCKLAELYLDDKAPDQASGPSTQAITLFKSVGDKQGEARASMLGARVKLAQKETADAVRLAEAAETLGQELGQLGVDARVSAVEFLGRAFMAERKIQQTIDKLVGTKDDFTRQGLQKGQGAVGLIIADFQVQYWNDMSGALTSLKQACADFQAAGAKKEEAAAFIRLAQFHFMKNEAREALKAAEEAMGIYHKLADMAGRVEASQVIATSHFALSGQGNAREARKAAEEAVTFHQRSGDKAAEGSALNILANAQLMNQSFAEAQRTARMAEAIFRDLDDADSRAGSLLLVAGAHLGIGEFAESKDVAKEARSIFQDSGNGKGEDSAEDFLDALRRYEDGSLNRADFMGFTMGSGESSAGTKSARKAAKEKKRDTAILSNIDLLVSGPKGEKLTVTFFDAFEARRASAPTRGPAARRASEAAAAPEGQTDIGKAPSDAVTFAVRLVPNTIVGEEVSEKPKYDVIDVEDKRIHLPVELGQPNPKFVGHCGRTDRMFRAMGGQKGLS